MFNGQCSMEKGLKQIKWGFIGCGQVTEQKSGPAFSLIEGSSVVAVMSRNLDKARSYAERHGIPHYYNDAQALIDDPDSWLVYVPMESCEYRLGGSLLSELLQQGSDVAPAPSDPDYFIDCFEVVREMVEDGVIIAGASVGRGGLMTALKRMSLASEAKTGASVSL